MGNALGFRIAPTDSYCQTVQFFKESNDFMFYRILHDFSVRIPSHLILA